MSWAVGYDDKWKRDIGYGVPSICDHPECSEEIDRGLSYVCCDEQPYGGERGCGLYFCAKHRGHRCTHRKMTPKPDTAEWITHKLTDPSWQRWRDENPDKVADLQQGVAMTTNADDLVQRLRCGADEFITPASAAIAMSEAADEIERLRAEIATLRDKLVPFFHHDGIDSLRQRAETAERELAALRARVDKAATSGSSTTSPAAPDGG